MLVFGVFFRLCAENRVWDVHSPYPRKKMAHIAIRRVAKKELAIHGFLSYHTTNFEGGTPSMNSYFEKLKAYIQSKPANYGDGESVLTMLYECHNENNPYDDEQIKADFNELYRLMNGMELREMDRIIYPVCKLCRDHERSGFIEGIKLGVLLQAELTEE